MPDEFDPKEKRDAIVAILNRYEESERWTREVTIDALRYIRVLPNSTYPRFHR